jgi:hypothetical protein
LKKLNEIKKEEKIIVLKMKKKGHGFNMIMITWVMKKCLRKCGSYL